MRTLDFSLYAITDSHWLNGRTLSEQVEEALKGGVTFVQFREKNLNLDDFRREAVNIKSLCAKFKVPFVINDDVNVAKMIDADGVHVGQDDMEVGKVREILGTDKIIGASAHSVEEAVRAERQGADYLGVGAVFPTVSKSNTVPLTIPTLKAICQAVSIPVVAIGGITSENLGQLEGTGISGIAVISAIFSQKNIKQSTSELKSKVIQMLQK